MHRHRIPPRFLHWPGLAVATLAFMTNGLSDCFAGVVFAHERPGSHKAVTAHTVANRDEQGAQRLYERVMEEFHKKDYEAALAGFRFFLELYGSSRFASSAQYWVGECEYRLRRYREAIESFSLALKVSNQPPKLAGATLKMALSYEKLGQTEASRILFERLLSDFSDTPEADFARKHLRRAASASLHLRTEAATDPPLLDQSDAREASP